jgi:Na+/melibiose symporter-like transporter
MNNVKTDFLKSLLDGLPLGVLLAGMCFGLIGVYYSKITFAAKRNPLKSESPVKWDWKYFINDNIIPFLKNSSLVILTIFLSIRFVQQFTGSGITMVYCLGVGLGLDEVIEKIKKFRNK